MDKGDILGLLIICFLIVFSVCFFVQRKDMKDRRDQLIEITFQDEITKQDIINLIKEWE